MVNILLNYECNKSCNFCFQKGVEFNSKMSLENFEKTINWLEQLTFFQNPEKRVVSILGGEPTLHPKLGKFIRLLKERNIKAIMFSNFIFNKKKFDFFDPEVIKGFVGTYNPKSWYKKAEYELMERNISELRKRGFEVKLSYNITHGNTDYQYILDACRKHDITHVRFATVFPNPDMDNNYLDYDDLMRFGSNIMSFVRDAKKQGLTLDLDCTVPLCVLNGSPENPSDEDIKFFLDNVNANNLVCKSALDINPDLSMFYCVPRANDVKINSILDYDNIAEINKVFDRKNDYERRFVHTFPECNDCQYRMRGVCQGGCLAMKKQRPNLIKNIGSKTKKVIGIKTWGGIGDGILITPALKALKQKYPDSEIRVTCNKNHEDILVNNPYIDFLSVSPDDSAIKNVELDFLFDTNYGQLKPSLNFDKHASEIIGDMVGVNVKSKQLDIFLSEKAETKAKVLLSKYKNPIVMHISSKCSKNQEWDLDNWEKLVDGIPEYDFIQIGLKNTDPYVKGAVDMRGTSIMEAIAIVKHSKAFVGVDSFVAHAANAVGTRGVVLFGPSNPEVWGHTNNINIYKGLKCAPCIDIIGGNPCQIGKKCMTKIGVKEVRESLLSIVDKNFIKSKSLLEKVLVYR